MRKTLRERLLELAPDQLDVLYGMALNRGLDPTRLTDTQLAALAREEAEFTVQCEPTPENREYARRLLAALED